MPRILNPGTLKTGQGKSAPDAGAARPSLTGAGLGGGGSNIGQPVTPVGSTDSGLTTHVQGADAHTAETIALDGNPDFFLSGSVGGALDELIGTVTKRPPFLGEWSPSVAFSGIPDWGFLKLRDGSLDNYPLTVPTPPLANLPAGTDPTDVFPYYFSARGPARDAEFVNGGGDDPRTDWLWNTGLEPGADPGMGYGRCHVGGFTRGGDVGPAPKEVMRTARLYPRPTAIDGATGLPERVPVTLSGTIFPADRGVLALLHFPPSAGGAMAAEFLAQPLITNHTVVGAPTGRVVAALLLGGGLLGDKCGQSTPCTDNPCDGGPGGIFTKGVHAVTGQYDPFAFPGRATGQYNLREIHLGVNASGDPLIAPWNDFNADMVVGATRTASSTIPAPGQVRLGTDTEAGETPVSYGIPILGGTPDYYAVAPVAQPGSLGYAIQGDSLMLSSNFFRYRLPVLKDYSRASGLKWTPRGDANFRTEETWRYFEVAAPYSTDYPDGALVDVVDPSLRTAGLYEAGFDEDYWTWQVARFRHTFMLPSSTGAGLREEIGSYWLVHFRCEADFEKCVRDGVFPWDVVNGYDVYGASLAGSPPTHIEQDGNLANEWVGAPLSPEGPAPSFGYTSDPYHQVRSTILMDPDGTALPAANASGFTWSTVSIPGTEAIVWVSGVAYHTPRLATTGGPSFQFDAINYALDPGFWTSYRTTQTDLTAGVAPATVASMNPLFFNMAPWAYGTAAGPLPLSLTVPTGVPGVGMVPGTDFLGTHRIEVPFQYLGSNAGGVFSDTNGPLDADDMTFSLPSAIVALGDDATPSFSRNARLRAYLRRPFNHTTDDATTLPFAADFGHGEILPNLDILPHLFHSTRFSKNLGGGEYGNYVVAAVGAPPNTSYADLVTASKDVQERFLDETYRLSIDFTAINGTGPYNAAAAAQLIGPGMGGWAPQFIELPVRANIATAPWNENSWLLQELHLEDLTAVNPLTDTGLQVAGLPERNPPQSAAVQVPFPSCGMLLYPQHSFIATSPESGIHFAGAQPDYSAAVGDRQYLRAFDAAFTNGVTPVAAAGATSLVFRLDGVTLEDIVYTAAGPGGLTDNRIAVSIKVPGLSTWMDIGRADGAGPGKQDAALDGAGCQVAGSETYNFQDPVTGYIGCYVKVNLGAPQALVANPAAFSGYTVGTTLGECPVMARVQMGVGAVDYDLEHRFMAGVFEVASKPGASPNLVRGLIGMSLVHPDDVLLPPL